jgi:hypothetical protein
MGEGNRKGEEKKWFKVPYWKAWMGLSYDDYREGQEGKTELKRK